MAAVTFRAAAEGWFSRFVAVPDSVVLNYYYTFGTAKAFMVRNLSWTSPTMFLPLLFFALTAGTLISLFRTRLQSHGVDRGSSSHRDRFIRGLPSDV